MKVIYRNSDNTILNIVSDDYAKLVPADQTLSATLTENAPSDIGTYFYGDRINGYKLVGTAVVPRTFSELKADIDFIENHGQFVALREVTAKRVADAGEAKVFGLITKKVNGGELTVAEQAFVDAYVNARDAILAEHDAAKQAILDSMVEPEIVERPMV
jgi:hypothetical protein